MRQSRAKEQNLDSLFIAYLAALLVGLVMIYSTSSVMAESRYGSNFHFIFRQLVWASLSLAGIWIISRVDLKKIAVYSAPAMLFTFLLLSVVFVMEPINGSHRWIRLPMFNIQPSEIFKFVMIFYLAFSLSNPKRNLSDLKQLIFPYVPIIGLGLLLVLVEPDLGTTIVTFATALIVFFLAGARMKHICTALIPLVGIGTFVVFVLDYKKARVMDYIAAISDPLQGSFQAKQGALTLGAGGIFGVGLGDGRQKLFFLPEAHTDFIFAAIGEEIGMIGLLGILTLLFYMLYRGLRIAMAQPDKFGFLLAAGMTMSLFINVAINLAVVTSLMPVTGLALPFISYGGSSLIISGAAIGVLLNLSKRASMATRTWKRSG